MSTLHSRKKQERESSHSSLKQKAATVSIYQISAQCSPDKKKESKNELLPPLRNPCSEKFNAETPISVRHLAERAVKWV